MVSRGSVIISQSINYFSIVHIHHTFSFGLGLFTYILTRQPEEFDSDDATWQRSCTWWKVKNRYWWWKVLRKQVRQTREKRKETCIQRRNQETQREEKCTRDVQVYDVFKSRKFVSPKTVWSIQSIVNNGKQVILSRELSGIRRQQRTLGSLSIYAY